MKKLGTLLVLLALLGSGFAQTRVSISSSVNKQTLFQSDLLIYNLRITAGGSVQPEEPAPPNVEGLRFHNQTSSRESRTSIVNGRLESSTSVTYSFYYYPTRSGKITIPAQSVRVARNVYRSDPITIEVKPDLAPPSRSAPNQPRTPSTPSFDPFAGFYPDPAEREGESLIICLPESQSVYRSEPAIVSYYLYTTEDVRSLNLTEERDFEGYGKAVYEQPNNLDFERVDYQGRSFRRSLLKRLVLYPHSTGTLKAPELAGSVRLMTFMYQNRGLRSKPATITVRELPPGAPSGFGGAIGSFSISEKLSSQSVKLGEAVIYSVQISGQGNFNQFTAPVLASDARIQISSPQVQDQLNAGTKGIRVLQYTLIPRVRGDIRLPQLKFSWLDSATGKYMSFTAREAVLSVKGGSGNPAGTELDKMLDKLAVQPLIERESYPDFLPWHQSWWFWLTTGLILLSLPVSIVWSRRRKLHLTDPDTWRDRTALKLLDEHLAQAKASAASSSIDFYRIAATGLNSYLSSRYQLPSHLSSEDLINALADKGFTTELLDEIKTFLADVQAARFAPSDSQGSSPQRDLERLSGIAKALRDKGVRK